TGLSIGISACFLILIFIRFELSYEAFHKNKDEIYRIIPKSIKNGSEVRQTMCASAFGPHVYEQFKEVINYTRLFDVGDNSLWRYKEDDILKGNLILVDSGFFDMFSFSTIAGNANEALKNPASIIISEKVAKTNFHNENPIGKIIEWENEVGFVVAAVIENTPENSHFQFDYIASVLAARSMYPNWATREGFYEEYGSWNFPTYYQLEKGADPNKLQSEIATFLNTQLKKEDLGGNRTFWLQNLSEIHFTKGIISDVANGDLDFVYAFALVAIFLLLIACINFTNLSTALATRRAKEVGLRKTIGAGRRQLLQQFLSETVIMSFFAFLLSLIIIQLAFPLLNELLNRNLSLSFSSDIDLILMMIGVMLFTGLLAGSYPGFYLASFQPVEVLKGKLQTSGGKLLRKILTVFQFAIASLLIVFTITVYFQMGYMKKSDLGFNKEQVMYFYPPEPIENSYEAFKQQILAISGIDHISRTNAIPGRMNSTFAYVFPGEDNAENKQGLITLSLEPDYLNVLDLEIVDGRNLSEEISSDALEGYLINETAAKILGLTNPVDHPFKVIQPDREEGKIVGVVKDFHFKSLQNTIEPLAMWMGTNEYYIIAVKLKTGNMANKIAEVQ
ncbi:MAG: ABC transporter permease, partial [Bacteroidota bacterium]